MGEVGLFEGADRVVVEAAIPVAQDVPLHAFGDGGALGEDPGLLPEQKEPEQALELVRGEGGLAVCHVGVGLWCRAAL
ncbi:hypothetical protein A3SI_15513 [Nitritalea halalkaliphila LW7]|uniref:Uncharacterized protein n=1 Tax=Nitritalea halalkaliphila LW7 TaxID=1189621 RepID=I5BYE6_9BACT|nr:hypothetical protein [Nitritalea halalkaliphila]EIM74598.1 hypothetical protein A3SI_15513 [Nitritalea halalkaliphila LW7]